MSFFLGIQDPAIQKQETDKCVDGMRQAQSRLALWAPDSFKAHFFVGEFVKEWKKRKERKGGD